MSEDWDEETPIVSHSHRSGEDSNSSWGNEGSNDNWGGGGGGRGGRDNRGRGNRGRDSNNRGRGGRDRNDSRPKQFQNTNEKTETVNLPEKFVGRFIGRGGSHINGLKDKYQVRINVERGEGDAYLELSGTEDLLIPAKSDISELIDNWCKQDGNDWQERKGYNRQNDGGNSRQDRRGNNRQGNEASNWRGDSQREERKNDSQDNEVVPTSDESYKTFDFTALSLECDKAEEKFWAQFPPLVKNFYVELDEVKNWNIKEVEDFRFNNFEIKVNRPMDPDCLIPILNPVRTFYEAFHQYPEILSTIKKVGFDKPTPIQSQAWPIIMSGEDVIGIAQTGTGKTLAFLLPAFLHIDGQTIPRDKRVGPTALVLAPTRELAIQIDKEVKKYEYKGIKSITIYGGASRNDQISRLKDGVDLIIATPGRLDDLMMAGHIRIESFSYIVLDEADRMLDMGFEPQIRKIMYRVNPKRQTIMTSATWPSGVRRLAKSYTEFPVQICVGSLDLAAVDTVTQEIHFLDNDEKFEYLLNFIKNLDEEDKVIVFVGKKVLASYLTAEFAVMRIDCTSIHGNLAQEDREQAIEDMISGDCKVLIATDVASRGIDIANITHVVNYDFPRDCEEYVHRVGRTGRAGKTGKAISYFTYSDRPQAKALIAILESTNQEVPEQLLKLCRKHEAQLASGTGKPPRRGRY